MTDPFLAELQAEQEREQEALEELLVQIRERRASLATRAKDILIYAKHAGPRRSAGSLTGSNSPAPASGRDTMIVSIYKALLSAHPKRLERSALWKASGASRASFKAKLGNLRDRGIIHPECDVFVGLTAPGLKTARAKLKALHGKLAEEH